MNFVTALLLAYATMASQTLAQNTIETVNVAIPTDVSLPLTADPSTFPPAAVSSLVNSAMAEQEDTRRASATVEITATSSSSWRVSSSTSPEVLRPPKCHLKGVHIIVARGSLESPGTGLPGKIGEAIAAKIGEGSTITAVDYPATIDEYVNSVHNGTAAARKSLVDYVAGCDNSKRAKVILIGWSQGAQVFSDLICGSVFKYEEKDFSRRVSRQSSSQQKQSWGEDLDPRLQPNVVAVLMYGDPTHAVFSSIINAGTSKHDGLFPRTAPELNAGCEPYTAAMRAYCDNGDRFCDRGNISTAHDSYFVKYLDESVDWAVWKYYQAREADIHHYQNVGRSVARATIPMTAAATNNIAVGSAAVVFAVALFVIVTVTVL